MEDAELVPLLIAAGGGGNAYLEDPESSQDQIPLEQYENSTKTASISGQTGAAGTVLAAACPAAVNLADMLSLKPISHTTMRKFHIKVFFSLLISCFSAN